MMQWMISRQLGRRNLSPIQRIAVAEKYRPIYERQAKENLRQASGGDRRSEVFKKNKVRRILQRLKTKLMYVLNWLKKQVFPLIHIQRVRKFWILITKN